MLHLSTIFRIKLNSCIPITAEINYACYEPNEWGRSRLAETQLPWQGTKIRPVAQVCVMCHGYGSDNKWHYYAAELRVYVVSHSRQVCDVFQGPACRCFPFIVVVFIVMFYHLG